MSWITAGVRRKLDRFITARFAKRVFDAQTQPFIVSFTFDDFPTSAAENGARVLEERGVSGTYYTCLGLIGQNIQGSPSFTAEHIRQLHQRGHEIACHTFDHVDAWHVDSKCFIESVKKNAEAVAEFGQEFSFRSFAYPKGFGTLSTKRVLGQRFQTVRSTKPGVNGGIADANFLLANSIYSDAGPIERQRRLIADARSKGGWLVFYTHDVCDSPSRFGCTTDHFAQVVNLAQEAGAEILTVADAAARLVESPATR